MDEEESTQHNTFYRFFVTGKYADAILRITNSSKNLNHVSTVIATIMKIEYWKLNQENEFYELNVHRIVLSSKSSYFDALFTKSPDTKSTLKTFAKHTEQCNTWIIHNMNQSEQAFRICLEWIYLRTLGSLSPSNCWECLGICRRVALSDLESHIGQWIITNLLIQPTNPSAVKRPLDEWHEFLYGAIRGECGIDVIQSLLEAAVSEHVDESSESNCVESNTTRYRIIKRLVADETIMNEYADTVSSLLAKVNVDGWPRDALWTNASEGTLVDIAETSLNNPTDFEKHEDSEEDIFDEPTTFSLTDDAITLAPIAKRIADKFVPRFIDEFSYGHQGYTAQQSVGEILSEADSPKSSSPSSGSTISTPSTPSKPATSKPKPNLHASNKESTDQVLKLVESKLMDWMGRKNENQDPRRGKRLLYSQGSIPASETAHAN